MTCHRKEGVDEVGPSHIVRDLPTMASVIGVTTAVITPPQDTQVQAELPSTQDQFLAATANKKLGVTESTTSVLGTEKNRTQRYFWSHTCPANKQTWRIPPQKRQNFSFQTHATDSSAERISRMTYSAHLAVGARSGLGERRPRVRRAVDVDAAAAAGGCAGRCARSGRSSPPRAQGVDQGVHEPLLGLAAGRLVHQGEALAGDLLHELGPEENT